MNLTDLIVELLQQGKSVTLPGIGTLDPKTEASRLDTANGTLSPSHKSVSISQRSDNAVDMIQQIAQKECVGEDVARQIWKNYLDALTDKLGRTSSHTFSGIGTLHRDPYGHFTFETDQSYISQQEPKNQLHNVNTYTSKPGAYDPFAAFDAPSEPESEPETEENSAPVETQPEIAEECAPTEMNEPQPEEEPAEAPSPAEAPEETTIETAPEPVVESVSTKEMAEESAVPTTAERDNMAETIESLRQLDNMPNTTETEAEESKEKGKSKKEKSEKKKGKKDKKSKKEKKEKKKKRKLWWLWLLLLLLGAAAFGYYYFIVKGNPIPFINKTTESAVNDNTASESAAQIQTESSRDYVAGDWTDYVSVFTFNTDLIEYTNQNIESIRDNITAFMREYIAQFARQQRYSAAEQQLMDRISAYTEERLIDLLNTDKYFVQRFLYHSDFINEYCHNHLKEMKAYSTQATIQTELMNNEMLLQMLNEVVVEFGIQQDEAIVTIPKAKKPTGTVYNAHVTTQSKQGYDIIAGFFKDKSRAERMASNLKGYGCDAYVIDKKHGYYVSMGSAPNLTRAEALRNHIKEWYDGDVSISKLK